MSSGSTTLPGGRGASSPRRAAEHQGLRAAHESCATATHAVVAANTVSYSFRAAWEEGAFHQLDLIDHDRFGREAKHRGVSLSIGTALRQQLEELDEAGALRPVAFATSLDAFRPELVFREEREFAAWRTYALEDDGRTRTRAFYSPWQLLYVEDATELRVASVTVDWLLRPKRGVSDGHRRWYEAQEEHWRTLDDTWRQTILLLVRLQSRYMPLIRGSLTKSNWKMPFDPEKGGHIDPREAARSFVPEDVLKDLDLTAEEIKETHRRLAWHGERRDPVTHFYMLLRMSPFDERAKVRGKARQAHDAYDGAEMLRRFYRDVTGQLLPDADEFTDLSGGEWKQRMLGHEPRLSFDHSDLRAVLVRHRLYPHHVHLVVEGETEVLVFRKLIEALGGEISRLGVTISTLRGVGRARLHEEILRAAKTFARFPVLVADREGDIERDVAVMKQEGLMTDETVLLWERSFEEDNFTEIELVQMVEEIAADKGAVLSLTPEALRAALMDQQQRGGQRGQGLAEVLRSLARNPGHGAVAISKKELAEKMTSRVLADIEEAGDSELVAERRPALRLVLSILRVI
jgi:hypothetical protein